MATLLLEVVTSVSQLLSGNKTTVTTAADKFDCGDRDQSLQLRDHCHRHTVEDMEGNDVVSSMMSSYQNGGSTADDKHTHEQVRSVKVMPQF